MTIDKEILEPIVDKLLETMKPYLVDIFVHALGLEDTSVGDKKKSFSYIETGDNKLKEINGKSTDDIFEQIRKHKKPE